MLSLLVLKSPATSPIYVIILFSDECVGCGVVCKNNSFTDEMDGPETSLDNSLHFWTFNYLSRSLLVPDLDV